MQSIAGATATGTHGTGTGLPNLSANLRSLELMLADGSVLEVDERSDPEAWRAARVSVGALGVVTAVTLQTVPAFTLEGVAAPRPLDEVLEKADQLVDGNEHFEFFTFPHSPLAMTRTNNRVDRAPHPRSPVREWTDDVLLRTTRSTRSPCSGPARTDPAAEPVVSRVGGRSHRVDSSYRIFATPRRVRFTEMEYAIPRVHAAEALRAVRAVSERREYSVPFPIEVCWVAPDDALLSPACGRETCYIAVHMFQGMPWEPYFRAVEEVMDGYDGRPHWGKRHFQDAKTLAPRYPGWDRFAAVRARMDPDGRFTNAYVERVLGRS